MKMTPLVLEANQPPDRFYEGGDRISAFRSSELGTSHQPEDWVASTTCCAGSDTIGLSHLPDGTLLLDAINAEPEQWLGPQHVAKYGADTKVLVKLLDAGQRLPVHAHPHVDWASKHLGRKHGKAESWFILSPGTVWLGLKESVSQKELLKLVQAERGAELLKRMHKIDVAPNQVVHVPPGTLHAIGEGVMVVEVQEPEDMSVMCEWQGFQMNGHESGHLGLGFETALTAVDTSPRTTNEIMRLITDSEAFGSMCTNGTKQYYEIERLRLKSRWTCPRGFAVVVVIRGLMELKTDKAEALPLVKGSTALVAYADGEFVLEGQGDLVIVRPPQ